MSNILQDNLDAILQDKVNNLKPENLRQGVTCLGVEGTIQSPEPIYATVDYTIKSVNSSIAGESVNNISVKGNYCLVSNHANDSIELYKITDSSLEHVDTFILDYSGGRACIVDIVDNLVYIILVKNKHIGLYSYNIDTGETYNVHGSGAGHNCNIVMNYYNTGYFIVYNRGDTGDIGYIYKINDNKTDYIQVTTTPTENINLSNYSISRPIAPNLFIAWSVNSNAYMYLSKCTIETGNWNTQSIEIDVVGKIVGASYDGTKVFILDKGIYALNSDLSIGERLADLTIDIPSNHFLSAINDKYYILTNYSNINTGTNNVSCDLYEFNNETNTFTYISSLQDVVFHPGHIASLSADTSLVNIYDFVSGDTQIGISFGGKNYYYSNNSTVTSDKVVSGYEVYTKGYQPMIGTMTDNGDVMIEPSTEQQTKEQGYYNSLVVNPVTSSIDSNILPENIKKDVSILGVTGTYDGNQVENQVKVFETEELMNSDTNPQNGNLALVYRDKRADLVVGNTYTKLYIPNTITFDSAITSANSIVLDAGNTLDSPSVRITTTAINFYRPGLPPQIVNTVQYSSTDGITYTRTDELKEELTIEEIYNEMYTQITIQENNYELLNQMFKGFDTYFGGLYVYKDDSYLLASTQLEAIADNVYLNNFYGKNGIEIGTLQNTTNLSKDQLKTRIILFNKFNEMTTSETSLAFAFSGLDIKSAPLFDTSNVTEMEYMYEDCTNLVDLPLYDTTNVRNFYNMVNGCPLSNDSLNNLMLMAVNCNNKSYSGDKSLKTFGLTEEQAQTCTTLSNYQAFLDAGWTNGYE